MLSIRPIQLGSDDYAQELSLRNRVLREPLGMKLTEQDFAQDVGDDHIGAFMDGKLVGCLILKPVSSGIVKMRQVAVDPSLQKSGVGRRLVMFAETLCAERNVDEIQLNARQTVVPFYQTLGYEVVGDVFLEVSIPHLKMRKDLR